METQKRQPPAVKGAALVEDVAARATSEDAKVQEILRAAREQGSRIPIATASSAGDSAEFMEQLRHGSAKWLADQVETKEFLVENELRELLSVNEKWVAKALSENRLFFVAAPSGEQYFPVFFCSKKYPNGMLEEVCKRLGGLPGISKHFFFMSRSTYLQSRTPLEALESGKLAEVLIAAEGFAER